MTHAPPTDVRTTPDGQLVVTWPDGHVSTYSLAGLRAECVCPVCRPAFCAAESGPRAVRFTRAGLLVSMYVLPLGLVFLLPSAETVIISGPVLLAVSGWLLIGGWLGRYRWARPLAVVHIAFCLFLMTLINVNNWSPRRAYAPSLAICTPYVLLMLPATWYVYRRPPPTKLPPSWHCRHCNYLLVGLAENRCPECGNGFDPADLPTTPPPALQSAVT